MYINSCYVSCEQLTVFSGRGTGLVLRRTVDKTGDKYS